jgi:hypothetical protein
MDEVKAALGLTIIIIVFGIIFMVWKAHHFNMSLIDLLLGAKPVVVIEK